VAVGGAPPNLARQEAAQTQAVVPSRAVREESENALNRIAFWLFGFVSLALVIIGIFIVVNAGGDSATFFVGWVMAILGACMAIAFVGALHDRWKRRNK